MRHVNLVCVVGARPNFVKMAPILRALESYPEVRPVLVHTGQHYDESLSRVFFTQLGIRRPDVALEVGSGTHGAQTARVMARFEEYLVEQTTAGNAVGRVVVVGDVNSTMAASLAAVKLGIPVAHVEAGLRSFDRSMPEEINRIVTDAVADLLFVSEPAGMDNLRREGHPEEQVKFVGNVMIDTLLALLPNARSHDGCTRLGFQPGHYGVVTLHRPANVDDRQTLAGIVDALVDIAGYLPIVFAVHPRTEQRLARFGLDKLLQSASGIRRLPPLGYIEFLALTSQARVIVTDSGGLQEESTVLGIPCLTMRPNTERPVTVEQGTSTLVGADTEKLRHHLHEVLEGKYKQGRCPELWDGRAAERIAAILVEGSL